MVPIVLIALRFILKENKDYEMFLASFEFLSPIIVQCCNLKVQITLQGEELAFFITSTS